MEDRIVTYWYESSLQRL